MPRHPFTPIASVRLAAALVIAMSSAAAAPSAQAQAQDAQAHASKKQSAPEARALFQQGVLFADTGRWAEAADRFRRALELRDSPVIAYNLGSALRELRHWVEACELFARAAGDATASPELRNSATVALQQLRPRLGTLTVHVRGQRVTDRIQLDGRALDATQLGVAIAIDPGTHQLDVQREQQSLHSETVLVFEGAAREVTVVLAPPQPREVALAAQPTVATTAALRAPSTPHATQAQAGTPWWVWAGAGTLVAGAITVATILIANGQEPPQPLAGDLDPPVLYVRPSQ